MDGLPYNEGLHASDNAGEVARRAERAEVARLAARLLADGREHHAEAAVERAFHELRLPSRAESPSLSEIRMHVRALEESRVGDFGRLNRIVAVLEEALEVLSVLESTVLAHDPEGTNRRPPEIYGRAAQGELDLDPVVHVRVETSLRAHVVAHAFAQLAREEVQCGALSSRYGMLDEFRFVTALADYRVLRIPPRMGVDPDLTVTRGERVPHAGYEELSRRIAQLQTR
ncbi:MAG: hypothetical protein QM516_02670 [Limnohabitans sp.]|jgi:hypothetical protein|nr:hypothetical protein [Limnohabitans sp.]